MIQSATNSTGVPDFGFGNLARFGPKAPKREDIVSESRQASGPANELTVEEERQIQQLKETDRKVRAHEQAHLAVGADLIRGGPSFTYQIGPDNKRYAIGGEVSIDTSPGRTPKETIPKAQHIRETALAPSDPSSQDYRVAAHASRMESSARIEVVAEERDSFAKEEEGRMSGVERRSSLYLSVGSNLDEPVRSGGRLDVFV